MSPLSINFPKQAIIAVTVLVKNNSGNVARFDEMATAEYTNSAYKVSQSSVCYLLHKNIIAKCFYLLAISKLQLIEFM